MINIIEMKKNYTLILLGMTWKNVRNEIHITIYNFFKLDMIAECIILFIEMKYSKKISIIIIK